MWKKFWKWFLCDFTGNHTPYDGFTFDGCSLHSTCARCGKSIMQDSQGGWF